LIEVVFKENGAILMCLILFAYDCHPRYHLVAAANRDEFYRGPPLPAAFCQDHADILAGKDLKEGGTWMGVTTSGRFATLTNYRDPSNINPQAQSRGHLVQNYLEGNLAPQAYLKNIDNGGAAYNGFNLLLGSRESLYCYSNREKIIRQVDRGVHGLSNSLLDVPWPKVEKGKRSLAAILQEENIDAESLFAMMADREQPPDNELPQTGVSLEFERVLAPMFVLSPDYGTKTTTVLLIEHNGKVRFWERSFVPNEVGKWNGIYYEFDLTNESLV
jgi:uncharacterized protein with NRDE domain